MPCFAEFWHRLHWLKTPGLNAVYISRRVYSIIQIKFYNKLNIIINASNILYSYL